MLSNKRKWNTDTCNSVGESEEYDFELKSLIPISWNSRVDKPKS